MSVSIGEEDRQSLTDVMRVMFRRYIPLMCVICAGIILCAEPITRLFFRDPAAPVCMMTVWGLRPLPLSMPRQARVQDGKKDHTIDVRVVHKDDVVILRLKG